MCLQTADGIEVETISVLSVSKMNVGLSYVSLQSRLDYYWRASSS